MKLENEAFPLGTQLIVIKNLVVYTRIVDHFPDLTLCIAKVSLPFHRMNQYRIKIEGNCCFTFCFVGSNVGLSFVDSDHRLQARSVLSDTDDRRSSIASFSSLALLLLEYDNSV